METFLSPKVKHLVCEVGAVKISRNEEDKLMERCLDENGILEWDYLKNVVFEGISKGEISEYYLKSIYMHYKDAS